MLTLQVPVADADFAAVQKWKVPLLQKAAKRLCTDPHFQFMRVELFKFRRENAWVEARVSHPRISQPIQAAESLRCCPMPYSFVSWLQVQPGLCDSTKDIEISIRERGGTGIKCSVSTPQ